MLKVISTETSFTLICLTYTRYGAELRKLCSAFRHAETELAERALRLESGWLRTLVQINFLKRMQSIADESLLSQYEMMLHVLVGKLEIASSILKKLVYVESNTDGQSEIRLLPKKFKYSYTKESFDKAIDAIESWQKLADPTWFLVLKLVDRQLDTELMSSTSETASSIPSVLAIRAGNTRCVDNYMTTGISLSAAILDRMNISKIDFADVQIAEYGIAEEYRMYILDSIISVDAENYQPMKKVVRELARRLQHNEPHTFGLLTCKGFVTRKTSESDGMGTNLTLVFRTPPGLSSPRSLRGLLLSTKNPGSLSNRFDIAKQLANAVSYVHTFGFVHKNIRPETILGFPSSQGSAFSIFLIGFSNVRLEDGRTRRIGDEDFDKNLYRHASRQGTSPEHEYSMQHDIYSLGVCLLEIGLWRSFVDYSSQDSGPKPSALLNLPPNPSKYQLRNYLSMSAKERFIKLARTELLECMGSIYSQVVETCLTCLDLENSNFGNDTEFEDEDGIRVGVRYIEKVSYILILLIY